MENKDFKKQNGGGLWLSDFVDKNGNKYYTGSITLNEVDYKISMFPNLEKTNPKAPDFKISFNKPKEEEKQDIQRKEDDVYVNFGSSVLEEKEIDLPF